MLKMMKNPDTKEYEEITQAVKDNNGYCPCLTERTSDTKCPCRTFREQTTEGYCHCGRYLLKDI